MNTSDRLTNQSRKVLVLAEDAARALNHNYVGTEHILLGLVDNQTPGVSDVLKSFSIDANNIRAEIAKQVIPGIASTNLRSLPLTQRAQQAIAMARNEAQFMSEHRISPEHLFLGLMNDPSGVACRVLLNLGIAPRDLTKEVFKVHLAQMKIVERAVRPLLASTFAKRKIREELSAHLAAIYDQELAHSMDSDAALDAASKRFGEPAELASELQASLPAHERLSYFIDRFFAYRAPESAAKFSYRMALHTFTLLAVVLSCVTLGLFLCYGWAPEVKTLARVLGAIALLTPPAQFVVWLAYIKMRDALWGTFGSRKSWRRAAMLDTSIAIVTAAYLLGVGAIARQGVGWIPDAVNTWSCVPFVNAIAMLGLARLSGPAEIRDTMWALLEIKEATTAT